MKADHDLDPETGHVVRRLPVPHSRSRTDYYCQTTMLDQMQDLQGELIAQPLRLILLWDVDRSHQLVALDLACPKRAGRSRDSIEHHFYVPVPQPGIEISEQSLFLGEPLEDIQINPPSLEDTGTDDGARSR